MRVAVALVLAVAGLFASSGVASAQSGGPVAHSSAVCADYPNQAAAQNAADTRDADGDGIYCEDLPCPCSSGGGGDDSSGSSDDNSDAQEQEQKREAAQRKAEQRRRDAARKRAAARKERLKRQRYARFNKSSWRISDVVDGDTIKVSKLSGPAPKSTWTVRLIGIDTPETKKPDTPVQCAGLNATASMLTLGFTAPTDSNGDGLVDTKGGEGRRVLLRTDPSQDLYDKYGRLLAYVLTLPGTDLGLAQIKQGWSNVYVFDNPFAREDAYQDAASSAEDDDLGAWGACGGDFHLSPGS